MKIIRINKNNVNPINYHNDNKLSFKAKGMLSYLLAKPDGYWLNVEELAKASKDGIDAVISGLDELVSNGYLEEKNVVRDKKGRIIHWDAIIKNE